MQSHLFEADEPTEALPGSSEKVGVLIWRMEQGYPLFHERDAAISRGMLASEDQLQRIVDLDLDDAILCDEEFA